MVVRCFHRRKFQGYPARTPYPFKIFHHNLRPLQLHFGSDNVITVTSSVHNNFMENSSLLLISAFKS